ncbi:MAG: efflux RND transporter periplasmic adaptor subunit [Planctomycetota bacterium]|nr:efflux RND transporter periplasmic adaptor subunit [Planctomycetota bacterium]
MSTLTLNTPESELGLRTRADSPAMGARTVPAPRRWLITRRAAFAGLAFVALAGGSAWSWQNHGYHSSIGDSAALEVTDKLVYHTVQRHALPITITERGTLSSQKETKILCDLETVPGQSGTRILWIVPNGTAIKQGDLLVEFDSAPLKDRLNTQSVVFEQSRAAQIQATVRVDNQKTQNETNLAAATLKVEMAKLALKMYEDESGGTFKISVGDLESKIQEAKNQIKEAQAALKMKAGRRTGVETLFKLGYRGKGDLDQAMHEHLSADFALVRSTNALVTAEANKQKLKQYEYPMRVLELKGAIATAERALTQVARDNEALVAQVTAAKNAADRAFVTEEEKLKRFKEQLEKSKVYAPHDGLVAHSPDRTPWGRLVADGELVTERFKILSLPDLNRMQVKLGIHESVVDRVKMSLPATVRIDAFPDASYQGSVNSVAVLPTQDSSLSSDVKVYDVIVTIDEDVEHLKPGMTAVVDIHVQKLEDVVTIPVQAVMQEEDETWCYIAGPDGVERRNLKLGISNSAMVQVMEGVEADDRVVLNPQAITAQPTEPSGPPA